MPTQLLPISLLLLQSIAWVWALRKLYPASPVKPGRLVFSALAAYKVFMGVMSGLLYLDYYEGGDMLHYADDLAYLYRLFFDEPSAYFSCLSGSYVPEGLHYAGQERALFFVKAVSPLAIFSLGNFWLVSAGLSLLCFVAAYLLSAQLSVRLDIPFALPLFALLIYPSVAFWSSGLLKESLSLAIIYAILYLVLEWRRDYPLHAHIGRAVLFLVFGWLLWQLKYYYAAVLLPLLPVLVLAGRPHQHKKTLPASAKSYFWLVLLLPLLTALPFFLHPNLRADRLLEAIVLNHDLTMAASDEGDAIVFEGLKPTMSSFLRHWPEAVFSGLFRPLPWEARNLPQAIAGLENALLLLICLLALWRVFSGSFKIHHPRLLFISLLYICSLAGLLALASPNFGSLLRYRVAYAPFFALLCLLPLRSWICSLSTSQSRKTT